MNASPISDIYVQIDYHYGGNVSVGVNKSLVFHGSSHCSSSFNAQHQEFKNGKNYYHSGNALEYIRKYTTAGQTRQIFIRPREAPTCYEEFIVVPAFKIGLSLFMVWTAITIVIAAVLWCYRHGYFDQKSNSRKKRGKKKKKKKKVKASEVI